MPEAGYFMKKRFILAHVRELQGPDVAFDDGFLASGLGARTGSMYVCMCIHV